MDNYPELSYTEDIILVTITSLKSDSGLLSEIIDLLYSNSIASDFVTNPPISGKGGGITFAVSSSDIDKLLKISAELKKYYSSIAFSINCSGAGFRVFNISDTETQALFSKALSVLKKHEISVRFAMCGKNEFFIITDGHFSSFVKELIDGLIITRR